MGTIEHYYSRPGDKPGDPVTFYLPIGPTTPALAHDILHLELLKVGNDYTAAVRMYNRLLLLVEALDEDGIDDGFDLEDEQFLEEDEYDPDDVQIMSYKERTVELMEYYEEKVKGLDAYSRAILHEIGELKGRRS